MICPYCSKEIKLNVSICPHCNKHVDQPVQQNWTAHIEQVKHGYDEHRGVVHGLQKDAIQNGWGHRLHPKGKDWRFVFELIKWKKDKYLLTITDINGIGLTGRNLLSSEIRGALPEDERLARFEHMYFSGESTQSAGLFGRGKLIFVASSKDYNIIYDSLTSDGGKYRLNSTWLSGIDLKNYPLAYEDENAKKMLYELTENKLKPLQNSGTRIIIINPLDEIVEAIYNGNLLKYIEETWWQIIQKYGVNNANISIKTEKGTHNAKVPKEYRDIPTKNIDGWKVKLIPNMRFEYNNKEYKIKKCHFIVNPSIITPEVRGLYLYRREMKVANIGVKEVPPEIEDKFYGYIEIETGSEFERQYLTEKSEGLEHYSFTNKNRGIIKHLRKIIQLEFDRFKNEIGFHENRRGLYEERTARILKESLEELNKRMGRLGISVGTTKITKDIKIYVEKILLPSKDNVVNIGDIINDIQFKVKNLSISTFNLNVCIIVKDTQGNQIEKIYEEEFNLDGEAEKITKSSSFVLLKEKYSNKNSIFISCIAISKSSGKVVGYKNIALFIGQKPQSFLKPVEIEIDNIDFPKGMSNKRVNYGESINNIIYALTNNTTELIKAKFKVKVLDVRNRENIIHEVYESDITILPLKEINIPCPDILVDKDKYSILDNEKGPVIIRATVVALEPSVNGTFEKAKTLDKLDTKFFVNTDSGRGVFDSTFRWEGGAEEPKSKFEPEGAGFAFYLNTTHPAYETLESNGDDSAQKSYTYEQMVRQTLILLLRMGKEDNWPDIEGKTYKVDIESKDSDKHEIIKSCLNTIDYLYADYLK